MAKVYGKQSKYIAVNESVNRKISKIALGFACLLSGVVFAYSLNLILEDRDINVKIISYIIFSVVYFLVAWWALRLYSKSELTADKYKLGQEGEDSVFPILSSLPDNYIVWRDLEIKYGNIDYVVVRPNEVFNIEVKNHKGKISFNGYELLRNCYPFKEGDFLKQVTRQYFELDALIKRDSYQTVPIISILVFSNKETFVDCNPYKPVKNGIYVLHERMLKNFIEHYHSSPKPINLPALELLLQKYVEK